MAGAARELSKKAAQAVLIPVYGTFPLGLRRLWRPPIHSLAQESKLAAHGIPVDGSGFPWDVLTTSRFVSYACLGWTVTGGSFLVFRRWGW